MASSDDDVIQRIYDAALDRAGFRRLGGLLAEASRSANGVIVLRNGMIPLEVSATTPAEALQDYAAYYGRIDPWAGIALAAPPWTITESYKHISDDELLRNEFYVDYARPLDMYHPIGGNCPLDGDVTLTIGVNRARSAPRFNNTDKFQLIELLRHLQRALQVRRRFEVLEQQAAVGFAGLHALAFGVAVAESDGRVVFVNAAAEALAQSGAGVMLIAGKITAAAAAEARGLAEFIRDAATGGPGGALRLHGASGAALLTLVSPLPGKLDDRQRPRRLALIAMRRGGESGAFVERILGEIFGLSRAEAQVVQSIANGTAMEDIAMERNVKITTVKTQLETVFRKTGAENQRELLRLIGSLPQIR